jgi:hypothetical protein
MMNKNVLIVSVTAIVMLFFGASCSTMNQSIREANILVELNKDDFEFSDQVIGRAETTQIFGIDFKRLFRKEGGHTISTSVASDISTEQKVQFNSYFNLPVIGQVVGDKTASYALYSLFSANPGYDVIFYPQYKIEVRKPIGLGFIVKKTKVEVKARMAKLK